MGDQDQSPRQTADATPAGRASRGPRRSLLVLAAVVLGFACARALPAVSSTLWFSLAAGAIALGVVLRGRWSAAALLAGAVLLAGGWLTLRVHEVPGDSLARLVNAEPLGEPVLLEVSGIVLDDPADAPGPGGALRRFALERATCRFTMRVDRVYTPTGPVEVSGRARVRVAGAAAEVRGRVRAGDVVRVLARADAITPGRMPGSPDRAALARQGGIAATLAVESPELLTRIEPSGTLARLHGSLLRLQGDLHARAERALAAPDPGDERSVRARALLGALLLGDRDPATSDADAAFTRLGLVHVVAISGFNLAVLGGLVALALRVLGDFGRLQPILIAGVVVLYMLVLPAEAPILRAGVLLLVFLAAEASGRRYDRVNLLGWIAVALLIVRPLDAWSLGFQLSFGVVAALLWIADRAGERIFGVPVRGLATFASGGVATRLSPAGALVASTRGHAAQWIKAAIVANLLAWAVAAPAIAHHTGLVTPLAPITGILVIPLVVLVLCAGYVALVVGVVLPAAAALTGPVIALLAAALVDVVLVLDEVPWATVRLPWVSAAWAAAATAIVVYWFVAGSTRSRFAWALTLVCAVWLVGEVAAGSLRERRTLLALDALPVGQGGATLLRSRGEAILWDCGSSDASIGVRAVPFAVRALGAGRVETIVISSPRLDRFAGVLDAAEPLGVQTVYLPRALGIEAASRANSPGAALVAGLRARGVEARMLDAGDRVPFGDAELEVLWPSADLTPAEPGAASLVALVRAPTPTGPGRILLTGDAPASVLSRLLDERPDLRAEVLEAPRRGGVSPMLPRLVESVGACVVFVADAPAIARRRPWDGALASVETIILARDGVASIRLEDPPAR